MTTTIDVSVGIEIHRFETWEEAAAFFSEPENADKSAPVESPSGAGFWVRDGLEATDVTSDDPDYIIGYWPGWRPAAAS